MLGVTGIRCDLGVEVRRPQAQGRVRGIVVAVNEVVQQPWMVSMADPRLLEHGCGSHVGRDVAPGVRAAQD